MVRSLWMTASGRPGDAGGERARGRGRRATRGRPTFEALERRDLMASGAQPYILSGDRWADPSPITYSFAPDGVSWERSANALNATMAARSPSADWRREVARALQTWASVAEIDFAEVPDSALPFDALGRAQGDARFGDIRIGGYDFGNQTQLAHAYTPPPNGTTAAGDVAINTATDVRPGGQYDLYSVVLHEAGHSLGLEHTDDAGQVMGANYAGVRAGLQAGDVAGIRAIYGARADDAYSQQGRGGTLATAVDLGGVSGSSGQVVLAGLELVTIGDSDYYSVVATSGGTLRATAAVQGVSLLSPQVSVYDASAGLLASQGSPAQFGRDVTASVAGVVAGGRYYIKVSGATSDVFAIGAYNLSLSVSGGQPASPPAAQTVAPPGRTSTLATAVPPAAAPVPSPATESDEAPRPATAIERLRQARMERLQARLHRQPARFLLARRPQALPRLLRAAALSLAWEGA